MTKTIEVPKGKGVLGVAVTGHTYLRLLDAQGRETFRSDSAGEHITAAVQPGSYTLESDGRIGKIDYAPLPARLAAGQESDPARPPMPAK
jgi:hypothetical protein